MWNWVKKAVLKITWFDFNSRFVNWLYGNDFEGVGKLIDLKIDFKEKKLNCSLKLNGEAENITVSATGFKLAKNGSKHYIKVSSAQINREWLETLANKFVVGKEIEISEEVYETITGMFGK
jgi:hypothetical protein